MGLGDYIPLIRSHYSDVWIDLITRLLRSGDGIGDLIAPGLYV